MAEIEITKASEVKVREIEWLWYPYIPFGKITVVQGDAGDGKSTFVLNLAAMLSQGQPMPFTDGTGQPPINIIYQSSEDDADDITSAVKDRKVTSDGRSWTRERADAAICA